MGAELWPKLAQIGTPPNVFSCEWVILEFLWGISDLGRGLRAPSSLYNGQSLPAVEIYRGPPFIKGLDQQDSKLSRAESLLTVSRHITPS